METKPSWFTSELWVTVIVLIVLLVTAWNDAVEDQTAAIAGAVVAGLYAVGRGLAKKGTPADPNLPANYRLFPRRSDGVRR